MIKNVIYFSLCNFLALIVLFLLIEGVFFVGTLGGALYASVALYYRLKSTNIIPSKFYFVFLTVFCSIISAAMCVSVDFYIYGDNKHSFLTLFSFSFFVSFFFVVYNLGLLYLKDDRYTGDERLKKSPVLKFMFKLVERANGNNLKSLSDKEILTLVTRVPPIMGGLTIIISLLTCSFLFINVRIDTLEDRLFVLVLPALIIVLLQLYTINRHRCYRELA